VIVLFCLQWNKITTLDNEEQSAGWKEVELNAHNVASGIYFYKLQVENFVDVKKMSVIKCVCLTNFIIFWSVKIPDRGK
jgi:hypothetical protein